MLRFRVAALLLVSHLIQPALVFAPLPLPLLTADPQLVLQPLLAVLTSLEAALSNFIDLPSSSSLERVAKLVTARRSSKIRLRQRLFGIEVYGSSIVVETDPSEAVIYDVRRVGVFHDIASSAVPAITRARALLVTANAFGISAAAMYNYSWNQEARLIFYSADGSSAPSLCYIVEFHIHTPSSRAPLSPHAVVDAVIGRIILSWDGITALQGVGGNSGIWGMQNYPDLPVSVLSDGVTCQFDTTDVKVQHLNSATGGAFVAWSLPCNSTGDASYDAKNGGFAPINDIARHGKITLDMYKSYIGGSPTGSAPLRARGHYGSSFENAFWDGIQVNVGDGQTVYYPLTSLDIIAHEFTHGFTGRYSALQYFGQSGGINEAFSDMGGEAAEFYYNGTNNFIIGDLVAKNGSGIRWLCTPAADGVSIDHASKYTPGMDPHISSGVYNKAFCLLAQKSGWDTATAFQIFAYANMIYWRQTTNFTEGACGVKKAALDLGMPSADVLSAFSAVGLSC